jgi:O-acetyl-ADP-ribose deacetylase (regulator of RNase III)
MVEIVTGDLFASGAQTLVNAVNCHGVMGKGIALEFKRRYPDMFRDYQERCARGAVRLSEPYLYRRSAEPHILNFPTKDHWRAPARLDHIIAGVRYMQGQYMLWGVTSLAVPALGCGLGQLDWDSVCPVLTRMFGEFTIPVTLYAPLESALPPLL